MTTNKPTVLIDSDGVLSDFIGSYLTVVHAVTGRLYQRDDIVGTDAAASLGLTPAEKTSVAADVKAMGFCLGLAVCPGAQDGVARLREIAEVHVLTSPWTGRHWAGERLVWLEKHFGFKQHDVTQTSRKWAVAGDVFVDDRTKHIDEWLGAHILGCGLVWETAHNRQEVSVFDRSPCVERVTSWDRVIAVAADAKGGTIVRQHIEARRG
jgi:5'(3')-deoxyribonucleotidase